MASGRGLHQDQRRAEGAIDIDGDGYITPQEYYGFLQKSGDVTAESLNDFMLTAQGDGRMDRSEFYRAVQEWIGRQAADNSATRLAERGFRQV